MFNRSYNRLLVVLAAGIAGAELALCLFYSFFFMNLFVHHLHKWNDVLNSEVFGANQSWQTENRTISAFWKKKEILNHRQM